MPCVKHLVAVLRLRTSMRLRPLVESGLTPLAALQAATLRPAEFLGRTAELGSIAPGKRADLVLLSADPLADIHNTTKIQAVWQHPTANLNSTEP